MRDKQILEVYKLIGNNFEIQTNIVQFQSFVYNEKKEAVNSFSLIINPFSTSEGFNVQFFEILINDNFDIKNNVYAIVDPENRERSGIFTKLKITSGATADEFNYEFTGVGFEYFWATRLVAPAPKINSEGNYVLNGTLTNVLNELFTDIKNGEVTAPANGVSNIENDKIINFFSNSINYDIIDNPNINLSFRFKNGFEILNEIISYCKSLGFEYHLFSEIINNKIRYQLYQGVDKSQNVILDNFVRGNLEEFEIEIDFLNEFNYATVAGQGEGSLRQVEYVDRGKSGGTFKEIYVNSSDSENSDELINKGNSVLEENKALPSINAKMLEDNQVEYKKDFLIGDFITVINQLKTKNAVTGLPVLDFEQVFIFEVLEANHSYEGQFIETDITIGSKKIIASNLVKNDFKNSKVASRK